MIGLTPKTGDIVMLRNVERGTLWFGQVHSVSNRGRPYIWWLSHSKRRPRHPTSPNVLPRHVEVVRLATPGEARRFKQESAQC
ncbi:MAG: hypothetical protein DYG93_11160 [Leptolyngbya sp. PLA2]|nr:hypothetical protein [Leptolyngbya sp.]MCE7972202.1 hypothetical protein [Leptolyngbya sp. PL-A2]MCQ3941220.1 hypothetical protein [cyanobacterium CYA1]MDL1905505.1 hypothetical protein [Synechococcales cyanobacterium CNB]